MLSLQDKRQMVNDPTLKVSKSGRTPEQQAVRESRKAARTALPSTSDEAESSSQALRSSPEASVKKRRREVEPVDELEVDLAAPEPQSRAEIRAARKKAKKGEPGGADTPANAKEDGEGEKENGEVKRTLKKRNSIWIGNLSFKTTPELLKDFVQKGIGQAGGEAENSVIRVNLPKKPGHAEFAGNKGFAYVDLATPELQAMAVGLSEGMLEGRRLLIKLGDDHGETPNARTPRPEKVKTEGSEYIKKQQHPESATLFVGNLPFDATEDALRDQVESNAAERAERRIAAKGAVEAEDESVKTGETPGEKQVPDSGRGGKESGLRKVRLGAFPDTGRCKGFAFLDFNYPDQAKAALSNRKNNYYDGRKLTLQYASVEATKRSGGRDPSKKVTQGGLVRKVLNGVRKGEKREGIVEEKRGVPQESKPRETPPHKRHSGINDENPVHPSPDRAVSDKRGKKWEAAGRPRPGAALAMAKREKVAIVEGTGEKIVFD